MKRIKFLSILATILIFMTLGSIANHAQTTEFSYQGFITDNNAPANGNYDLEFKLFDAATAGTMIGTLQRSNVAVSDGIFGVVLDFGAFPPTNRFLEIGVRPPGGSVITTLAPRVKLLSTPYSTQARNAENAVNAVNAQNAQNAANSTNATNAINAQTAQNALQLGGTPANQFVLGNDPRLNDSRNPLPGNANYIQNTTTLQGTSNFNVSGNGTAGATLTGNVVSAISQFNIGNARVLASPGSFNFFAGPGAGTSNTTGTLNSFFGANAGFFNTTGGSNTFVGFEAGRQNNAGANNSYFGRDAGRLNNTGNDNSFFGNDAGQSNTTGGSNSFFGKGAGADSTTATGNSFFGALAGNSNTTGANNAFFGFEAGSLNTEAFNNSFFGFNAGKLNTGDRNSFFGTRSGDSNTTGDDNSFFGTDAGAANTTAVGNSFFGARGGVSNTTGHSNAFFGFEAGRLNTTGSENSFFGYEAGESNTTGISNSFFGYHAGKDNTTGRDNSYFGHQAGVSTTTGLQNSYFGVRAGVLTTDGSSNTMMGTFAGEGTTTGNSNSFFGVLAGNENTTGDENTIIGHRADVGAPNLTNATAIGAFAFVTQSNSLILGSIANVNFAQSDTKVGIGTTAPFDRLHVNGIIRVETLGAAGATALCRNAGHQISTCSSSLRYKTGISPFRSGLNLANKLQPIVFNWKEGGMRDLGLGAEEVAAVEPLLATYNDKGEVEGVKYDRVGVVLLNAVKEQQAQIEEQKKQLLAQQAAITRLERKIEGLSNQVVKIQGKRSK
jgi:Chaperone of endosialidase